MLNTRHWCAVRHQATLGSKVPVDITSFGPGFKALAPPGCALPTARPRAGRSSRKSSTGGFLIAHHPPPGGRFCSGSHPNFGGRGGTIKRLHRPLVRPPEGGRGPRVRRGSRGPTDLVSPGWRFCSGSHPNVGGTGGTIKRLPRPWLAPARGRARPCVGLGRKSRAEARPTGRWVGTHPTLRCRRPMSPRRRRSASVATLPPSWSGRRRPLRRWHLLRNVR